MSRLFDPSAVQRENNAGAGSGGQPPAPPVPPPPAPQPAPPAGTPPVGPTTGTPDADRIRQLETELEKTRREAAGYRTGSKGQLAEFAKALNALVGGQSSEPADPATLLKQFQERDQARDKELRQLKVDNALGDIYAKHGVKPKLTRALLESEGMLSTLDPADTEFSKTLNTAVTKLLADNPEIKLGPEAPRPPVRSGPDTGTGGNGTPPQLSREDLGNMTSKQVADAYQKGQLNGILKRQ